MYRNNPVATRDRSSRPGAGFTLIELLVVIAIIAVLAAILFPVFAKAREKARQNACLSNTRQIGMALMQYVQDFDETVVPNDDDSGQTWIDLLQPYIKGDGIFVCPSASEEEVSRVFGLPDRPRFTYALNNVYYWDGANNIFEGDIVRPFAQIEDTAGTVFCGDRGFAPGWGPASYQVIGDTFYPNTNPPTIGRSDRAQGLFVARHNGGLNLTFFDGHAKWMRIERLNENNNDGTRKRYFTPALD